MTTFDDREKAFEEKFVHDQEFRFRVNARRNRMIVEWAVEQMGLPFDEESPFITEVVNAHIEGGDEVVIRKIINFTKLAGKELTPSQIKFQLDLFFDQAKKEIMTE